MLDVFFTSLTGLYLRRWSLVLCEYPRRWPVAGPACNCSSRVTALPWESRTDSDAEPKATRKDSENVVGLLNRVFRQMFRLLQGTPIKVLKSKSINERICKWPRILQHPFCSSISCTLPRNRSRFSTSEWRSCGSWSGQWPWAPPNRTFFSRWRSSHRRGPNFFGVFLRWPPLWRWNTSIKWLILSFIRSPRLLCATYSPICFFTTACFFTLDLEMTVLTLLHYPLDQAWTWPTSLSASFVWVPSAARNSLLWFTHENT